MDAVQEIKNLLGIKTDGMAYMVMTCGLPDEKLVATFTRIMNQAAEHSGGNPGDRIPGMLSKMGIDLSAVVDGMEEKEKKFFYGLVAMWMGDVRDAASAGVFVLMLRHYLIPTFEKKKALEKMLTLTGKEAS